jgi:hypothetical protein
VTQMPQGTVSTVSQVRTGPMPTGGRYGWYRDHEGNEFRRATTLIKKVETDTYNLDQWKLRQVAEGLAIRDDLVLSVKAMGRPKVDEGWSWADKKKINDIVKDAMAAAKQRDGGRAGTAHHDLTERVDRGEPIDAVVRGLPADVDKTIRAYAFLRRENGWRNVEVERTVVCDELEVAGTFDRVDLIPGLAALLGPGDCQYGHRAMGVACLIDDGHDVDELPELPVINDVKTEESPWLNGLHIAPQLAIYSRSRKMWRPTGGTHVLLSANGEPKLDADGREQHVPNGEYVPAPCVRQDVAVVVHLRDGRAEPMFVNLAEGWEAAQAAYAQMNRESRAKTGMGKPGAWFVALPNVKRPQTAALFVQSQAAKDPNVVRHSLPAGTPGWTPPASGCDNCAPLIAGASMTRVDGTDETQTQCIDCGSTAGSPNAAQAGGEVAVKDPATGLVSWHPATEPPVGTRAEVGGLTFTKVDTVENVVARGALDEVDRSAIEAVWSATSVAGGQGSLSRVYEIYTVTVGRQWGGRVAEAATARQRQIECVQRALHTGGGKCACGWMTGIPA